MKNLMLLSMVAVSFMTSSLAVAGTVQTGRLTAERCRAVRSAWSEDPCRAQSIAGLGGSCQVVVEGSDGQPSSVALRTSLNTYSSSIGKAFMFDGGLNALGYNMSGFSNDRMRGTAYLKGAAARSVIIYDNLDDSGTEYIRYTCRGLK